MREKPICAAPSRAESASDQGRADAPGEVLGALIEGERRLSQALGIIVEFGDLNGFRNLSDQELGASVMQMAIAASNTLDRMRVAIALSPPVAGSEVLEKEDLDEQ